MAERVYCLYRVSTTKQADHDEQNQADIPMHRKACHEFVENKGWTIIREEQETGISGYKVSAADCDKIQLIREHAEKGKFDILLVFMFDRIGRKAEETPFIVEWFVKKGIKAWSVNEGEQRFESHTDRLTNYIRFWQADSESHKTSIRIKTALAQMVQEGRFRGGIAPYGYRLEKSGIVNKRKYEVNKLVIEEEAKVVRMIYNLCVSAGYGRWRIANLLNDKGIRNRKGENWHEASVGIILHNVTYKGVLRSGTTYSEPAVFIYPKSFQFSKLGKIIRPPFWSQLSAPTHKISMPILFDDCAFSNKEPYPGKQDEPVKGVHNSGWTPSPGFTTADNPWNLPQLEAYVKDIIGSFKDDRRIVIWDLYNEPGNSGRRDKSLQLSEKRVMELSDVISFHSYTNEKDTAEWISKLKIS